MPLADQQPGGRGLLLLRERASQRIALFRVMDKFDLNAFSFEKAELNGRDSDEI
jgi:hypothetical protein